MDRCVISENLALQIKIFFNRLNKLVCNALNRLGLFINLKQEDFHHTKVTISREMYTIHDNEVINILMKHSHLDTFKLEFTALQTSIISYPIFSPSRSQSVQMISQFAFLASISNVL